MAGQWEEFEKAQQRAAGQRAVEVVSCPHCGSTWLYKANVDQFSAQQVTLMQDPVSIHGGGFPLLVCAACGRAVKANVALNMMTRERKLFDDMSKQVFSEEAQKQIATVIKKTLGVLDSVPSGTEVKDGQVSTQASTEVPAEGDSE